ncbi:MAG: riboflavin biosynthesis protein RibF [Blautia sp.]|mgnify:CR=1 FL=1|nr:riboflavin biosynthesis protein RibF [Blautia sp.]
MEYTKIEETFPKLNNSAVILGKFDGLHRGHQSLINTLLREKDAEAISVVFAFQFLDSLILSYEERRRRLESYGIDLLLECPLTEEIRHMSPKAFVKEILVDRLQAALVVVGEDFRFGYERKGTVEELFELGSMYGFRTIAVSKEMDGNRKISSSSIRDAIALGDMETAERLLGAPFSMDGEVVHGAGLGHRKLLPTINLIPSPEKKMPPGGVYFTNTYFEDQCYHGITNIGYKPTVDGSYLGVETYLFACKEDLYGRSCRTDFLHYSRPERKFRSIEELKEQLLKDQENGCVYFGIGGKK